MVKPKSAVSEREETILTLGNVVITTTLAKFPRQTFPINGIGSVTLVPPKRGVATFFAILFGFISLACFFSGSDGAGVGLFFFILAGVAAIVAIAKRHALFIRTASSDTRAMEGDHDTLNRVKSAIETAATVRG